jgi:hypothetical protein
VSTIIVESVGILLFGGLLLVVLVQEFRGRGVFCWRNDEEIR